MAMLNNQRVYYITTNADFQAVLIFSLRMILLPFGNET